MSQAKVLTPEQVKRALDFTRKPMDQVTLRLSFAAGLRVAEIATLEWRDVTDADGAIADTLTVRAEVAKSGRSRAVPMSPELVKALATWREASDYRAPTDRVIRGRNGGLTTPNTLTVWFRRLYAKLGFSGVSSHSGRRSFITTLARNITTHGGSLRDVQALAGHASLATTQIYVDPHEDAQRRAIAALSKRIG